MDRISALIEYLDGRLGKHAGKFPEMQWHCPFCLNRRGSESAQAKFRFNADQGKGTCFRCGYGTRTVEKLLRDLNGGKLLASEQELLAGDIVPVDVSRLADEVLVRFYARHTAPVIGKLRPVPLPVEYVPLWTFPLHPIYVQGRAYLTKMRKLDPAKLEEYRIGYCAHGRYAQRVVFPVFQNGKQVYFTTRYAGDHEVKSLNPENASGFFHKTDVLYNYDQCVGKPEVYLGEGPLDTIAMNPAAGFLGKRVSPAQMDLLQALSEHGTKEFVVGLDPDASREAYDTFQDLSDNFPRVSYLPMSGGDPYDNRGNMKVLKLGRREMTVIDKVKGMIGNTRRLGRACY